MCVSFIGHSMSPQSVSPSTCQPVSQTVQCTVSELLMFQIPYQKTFLLQGAPYVFERFSEAVLRSWVNVEMKCYHIYFNSGIYLSNTTKKEFVTSAMASLQSLAFFGQKAADTHNCFGEDSLYSLKAVRKFSWIFKSFIVIISVEKNLLKHWHSLHNSLLYLGPLELLGIQ